MTGLYLFAAAGGIPLVLWFLFSGGDEGGGADDGVAGVMFRLLPLSSVAFAIATFGVCGLVLGLADTSGVTTFVAAAVAGALAAVVNSTLYAYLRRSESTTEMGDEQLQGKIGRVVLPVTRDQRGRIALTVGGQQIHLSAQVLPEAAGELPVGTSVVVVEMRNGIASVAGLDLELN